MVPKDIGAYIKGKTALTYTTATTASVTTNGASIDRRESTSGFGSHYQSCKVLIPFLYTKATSPTITIAPRLQHSSNSSTWATLSTGAAVTVAAATTGSGTLSIVELDVDLTTAKRYVRCGVTAQLTVVSSVNSLNFMGVIAFGGADVLPAT